MSSYKIKLFSVVIVVYVTNVIILMYLTGFPVVVGLERVLMMAV